MATITSRNMCTNYNHSKYWDSRAPATVWDYGSYTVPAWLDDNLKITTSNPKWKDLVAKGSDATFPYTLKEVDAFKPAYIKGTSISDLGGYYYIGACTSIEIPITAVFPSPPGITELKDRALASILRHIGDETNQFNSLAPLAELREMRALIRDSAHLSTSLVNDLLGIRKKGGKSAFKRASDAWLGWSFGMKPLMSDTAKVSQSIATYLTGVESRNRRFSGTAKKDWTSGYHTNGALGAFWANKFYEVHIHHVQSYTYTAGISYKIASSNDYGALKHFGFTIPQLIPAAWELTAYSWLFDYFTTTGAYLEDTFTVRPFSANYCSGSNKYVVEYTFSPYFKPNYSYVKTSFKTVPGTLRTVQFSREKLATLPGRSLRVKSLDEIGLNAVNRLLNLSALLISRR